MSKAPFEIIKSNLENYGEIFKEKDPNLKLRQELFSMQALNPFIAYNSSPRGLMMSSHVAQLIVTNKPEKNIIQTTLDRDLAKYVISAKFLHDVEIVDVIKRYNGWSGEASNTEFNIIYRRLDDGKYDILNIKNYNKFHTHFGFRFKFLIDPNTMYPGQIFKKDTYVAVPETILNEDMDYGIGVNANVAMITLPEVAEDGVVVSKSYCEKNKFKIFETRILHINPEEILLNLYGNDEVHKPFPEIGEYVNENGILMATRKVDDIAMLGLLTTEELQKVNPIFDKAVYADGKIIDIKIYKNKKNKMIPQEPDAWLEKYIVGLEDFNKRMLDTYENIKRSSQGEPELTPKFSKEIATAMAITESRNGRVRKIYRKDEIELYRIEIVIEKEVVPTVGFKITDLHGGKSVIIDVWDDADMPRDDHGNVADIIADPSATVSRLNIGRLYERYIKNSSRVAKKLIRDEVSRILNIKNPNGRDIDRLTDDNVIYLFKDYVNEFVTILQNEQSMAYKQVLDSNNIPAMKEVLKEIVDEEFYIFMSLDMDKRAYEIVTDLELSKFKALYGSVEFNYYGKHVRTKTPIMIAPMYFILLSKIADDYLVTPSAKLNHFGLPISVGNADKFRLPYRNSPTKILGETEGRLYASYVGREFLAEIKNRNSSIEQHKTVYRNVLNAPNPFNIIDVIPRDKYKYEGDRAVTVLTSLFNSIGVDFKFVEDNSLFHEPQELMNKISDDLGIEVIEADEDIKGE